MIGESSLLEPEFAPYFEAWKKEQNPRTSGALLKAISPVLDSAMRSYAGKPSPTLRSRAKMMALDAMGKYDPRRAKLRTHLMVNLQGLRRAATQEGQIIHLPERVGLDLLRMHEAEEELRERLGRAPSDMELADYTGLSRKRIGYIRQARPGYAEGQLTAMPDKEDKVSVGPGVVSPARNNAWHEFVYHDLHPIDQVIMEHSLGLHGKPVLSKQQIAKKLRLSPSAVSQRAARIQAKLDRKEELAEFLF